ncbi:MAG: alpha/beta hydrolase [Myxococcota bacterium]
MLKHQLKVNGFKVSYYYEGRDKDPSEMRLFLHGWGLSGKSFKHLIHGLAQDYPVIAIDLPGFGDSHGSHFWGFEAYAQFVVDFMDALKIPSAHMMGQSMGGGISLATAALFPERIKSVVVMNSAGIPMRNGQPSIRDRVHELWAQGFDRRILIAFAMNSAKNLKGLIRSVKVPVRHDLRRLLPLIKVPVLLAWGDCDKMLPFVYAEEMAALIPGAKIAPVSGGFHEWGLVQPEIFVSLAKQFADSLSSRP